MQLGSIDLTTTPTIKLTFSAAVDGAGGYTELKEDYSLGTPDISFSSDNKTIFLEYNLTAAMLEYGFDLPDELSVAIKDTNSIESATGSTLLGGSQPTAYSINAQMPLLVAFRGILTLPATLLAPTMASLALTIPSITTLSIVLTPTMASSCAIASAKLSTRLAAKQIQRLTLRRTTRTISLTATPACSLTPPITCCHQVIPALSPTTLVVIIIASSKMVLWSNPAPHRLRIPLPGITWST